MYGNRKLSATNFPIKTKNYFCLVELSYDLIIFYVIQRDISLSLPHYHVILFH